MSLSSWRNLAWWGGLALFFVGFGMLLWDLVQTLVFRFSEVVLSWMTGTNLGTKEDFLYLLIAGGLFFGGYVLCVPVRYHLDELIEDEEFAKSQA